MGDTIGIIDTIQPDVNGDVITNSSENVTINGGSGDDTIRNSAQNVTILGGTGNDAIENSGANVLFKYNVGDGDDAIYGFNETSTLQIVNADTYSMQTLRSNIIVIVGDSRIVLRNAASLSAVNIDLIKFNPLSITGTDSDDNIKETVDGATIQALGGNDSIRNYGDDVLIDSGEGNDSIRNYGDNVTMLSAKIFCSITARTTVQT